MAQQPAIDRVGLERAAMALYDGQARYQEATGPRSQLPHWNQLPWGHRQQYVAAARVVVDVYGGRPSPSGPRPKRWLAGAAKPRLRKRLRGVLKALGASGFPGRTLDELVDELSLAAEDVETAVRELAEARLVYLPLGSAVPMPWLPTDDGYRVLEAR